MPVYTFTPNTPNASDPMNTTQSLILNNFKAITELVIVNHVGFNVDNFGKHNVLNLQVQGNPTTTATEIDMFTKVTGSPNPAELYIKYPSGASTTTPVQISVPYSAPSTGVLTQPTPQTGYVTYPSGIKLSFSFFQASSTGGSVTVQTAQYTNSALVVNATANTPNSGFVQSVQASTIALPFGRR